MRRLEVALLAMLYQLKFLNKLELSFKELLLRIDEFLKSFKEKNLLQLERENRE